MVLREWEGRTGEKKKTQTPCLRVRDRSILLFQGPGFLTNIPRAHGATEGPVASAKPFWRISVLF